MLGIFIQAGGVRLQKGCHLVDEGAGSSGAYTVHTLLHVSVFKINDFGVFAAQFDGHISLRRVMFQRGGYGNHFLDEVHTQVFCQGKAAGTGDHRADEHVPGFLIGFFQQVGKGLPDVGIMPLVVCEDQMICFIQQGYFDCGRSDIDTKLVNLVVFH